jgi:flavin reductase (DIM6/NTAB) family NADH-FMN oxidoreductase RutF
MTNLKPKDIRSLRDNTFKRIAEQWMLVTAGNMQAWNTMTASWGGLGHLWNRDVAFVFIRPTRHTYGFMERQALFTLSFFGPDWRAALTTCGTVSGRDCDKAAITGLKPLPAHPDDPASPVLFEQAEMALVCRSVHKQDLDPAGFMDQTIHDHYNNDFHRLYVAEILECLYEERR